MRERRVRKHNGSLKDNFRVQEPSQLDTVIEHFYLSEIKLEMIPSRISTLIKKALDTLTFTR